jgi:hypothetical protein
MSIEEALSRPIPADPDAPEFDGVRADLARLFIRHRADLGMTVDEWPDARIIAETSRIAGAIMACGTVALDRNDTAWLERHRWFSDAAARIFDNGQAVPLDG